MRSTSSRRNSGGSKWSSAWCYWVLFLKLPQCCLFSTWCLANSSLTLATHKNHSLMKWFIDKPVSFYSRYAKSAQSFLCSLFLTCLLIWLTYQKRPMGRFEQLIMQLSLSPWKGSSKNVREVKKNSTRKWSSGGERGYPWTHDYKTKSLCFMSKYFLSHHFSPMYLVAQSL